MVTALGIDVGSTSTKAVLACVEGVEVGELAVASRPTPDQVTELLATVVAVVAEVLGRGAVPDVVGVASMAETGAALDADARPLTPLLRWDGHRAGAQAEGLARTLGREELFARTGVRPAAKVPLATLAWL
ncbi:FGGY family carbohydrate kinase, partial [Cellulomonas bogoriensis]|uniref:FGGY family carbohydrate kinase n=1 Tax=Cellulomonas bogoriensis TaxID=301388 RepID=UPI000551C3CC